MGDFVIGVLVGATGGAIGVLAYYYQLRKEYQLGVELLKRAEGDVQAAYKHIANYPAKFIAGISGRKQQ
jgi:hypothetical protein